MRLFPEPAPLRGVSVRSDVGVCRACGAVELARDMVRLGAYLYACRACSEAPAEEKPARRRRAG